MTKGKTTYKYCPLPPPKKKKKKTFQELNFHPYIYQNIS